MSLEYLALVAGAEEECCRGRLALLGPIRLKQSEEQFSVGYYPQGTAQIAD